jgi:uncharacterized membrane protein
MARALVIASIVWPVWLGADVWHRAQAAPGAGSFVLHVIASRICHQRPERSFHTAGAKWPVCARCSGLYLAAPFGAVVAVASRRVRRVRRVWHWLGITAAPTIVTLALEWLRVADPGNGWRGATALPLGAFAAFLIVSAVRYGDRVGVD